jgi:acetyl-CoA carboxylase biotin carboxyl carrier protein
MDLQIVKALIDAFATSNLAEMEYTADGATLRLVRRAAGAATLPSVQAAPTPRAAIQAAPPAAPAALVTAPLYGVVHLQRSPDAPPFVAAGQDITTGQVLCQIEAMKVFTEIRADRDGTIADVLVQTGQEVDAGQPLFRLG